MWIELLHGKRSLNHKSNEEIEIKENTIWTIGHIKQNLTNRVYSIYLNDLIWLLSQYKQIFDGSYHRVLAALY